MTLRATVYSNAEGFTALKDEWNELLHDSAADTVFLTYEWQTVWWKHLGEGQLALIAFRDDNDRLMGLAPLFVRENQAGEQELNTVGCVDVSDYLDLIARRGHEEAVFGALLDLLANSDDPSWDVLNLCNIRQESPTLSLLKPLAEALDYQASMEQQEVCPIVALDGSWDDYLATLDGKERRELRRKMRKANPFAGVEWYIVDADHDLEAEVDRFLALMASSREDKAEFLHEDHRAFMQDVAQTTWQAGWLELAFLTIQGEPAATMMNFVYNNQTLLYNSGLDAARFLRMSPGIVLTAFLIQHSIEQGRTVFDFLRGDEGYKYQLGGNDTPIYQLSIRR
jgi:CelD/BcsL family acetyltransferase involved in cellulose biosynthesis